MSLEQVMRSLDQLEAKMNSYAEKAEAEAKNAGEMSVETKNALDALGEKQKDFADDLLELKQRMALDGEPEKSPATVGNVFTKSDEFSDFARKISVGGRVGTMGIEVKNTVTNTVGNTFSQRRDGVVGGAFREFTLEQLLATLPAVSNSIDYVRENVFTNAAAETAEGAAKPESAITFTPVSEPIATVAHWIKISKQLAADNAALAAYIDSRMIYGVNLKVENQIIQGNGAAPNMSGFTKTGNFTAHGYTAANLTSAGLLNNRFDLIGKIIGDLQSADWPADVVVVNPADWWSMRLTKDSQGRYLLGDPGSAVAPSLYGLPVVSSNAVVAGKVVVASLMQAATFYNREAVTIQMSDSDSDNFTKNLITLLAERRCAIAVERPAAVRYGDLVPA